MHYLVVESIDLSCWAEFSAYDTLTPINNKPDYSSEYQPDKFQDKLRKTMRLFYPFRDEKELRSGCPSS